MATPKFPCHIPLAVCSVSVALFVRFPFLALPSIVNMLKAPLTCLVLLVATLVVCSIADRSVQVVFGSSVCYDQYAVGANVANATVVTTSCNTFYAHLELARHYTFFAIIGMQYDHLVLDVQMSSHSWSAWGTYYNVNGDKYDCGGTPATSFCGYSSLSCFWSGNNASAAITVC
jgi:hypothetical protein